MIPVNSFFYDFKKKIEELSGYEKERFVNIFWQKVYQMRCPLIYGEEVIFLNRNRYDTIHLIGDIGNWEIGKNQLNRISSTDISWISLILPNDAALEYKFCSGGNFFVDSLNPAKSRGTLGENSLLKMPYYHENDDLNYQDNPTGQLLDFVIRSGNLGYFKPVYVYLPHDYDPSVSYDYLVFLDGNNYLQYGNVVTVLDNLVHRKKIRPCLAFFIESRDYRYEFSICNEFQNFFFQEFLPEIRNKFLLREDGNNLLIGEAMAGVAAIQLFSASDSFNVLVQSPQMGEYSERLCEMLKNKVSAGQRMILQSGTFETMIRGSEIHNDCVKISEMIGDMNNFRFQSFSYSEGHSWHNWSNHLIDALIKFRYDVF